MKLESKLLPQEKPKELNFVKSIENKLEFVYERYLKRSDTANSLPNTDPNKLTALKLRNQAIEFIYKDNF